jgi:hypothetical protein
MQSFLKLMHVVRVVHTVRKNDNKAFICLACETSTICSWTAMSSSQTVSPQVPEALVETIQFVFTHISPLDMNSTSCFCRVSFRFIRRGNPPIHIKDVGVGFTNHLSPRELIATIYKIISFMYHNSLSALIRPY